MSHKIKRPAVLGSGVMAKGIAAHLPNNGIPTIMLDIAPNELTKKEKAAGPNLESKQVRKRMADENKKGLLKQNPSPITAKSNNEVNENGNMKEENEKLR